MGLEIQTPEIRPHERLPCAMHKWTPIYSESPTYDEFGLSTIRRYLKGNAPNEEIKAY